jgi:hypothetical protein
MQYTSVTCWEVTRPASYMAVGAAFTGWPFPWGDASVAGIAQVRRYAMNTWARGIGPEDGDAKLSMALAILAPPTEEGSIGFA